MTRTLKFRSQGRKRLDDFQDFTFIGNTSLSMPKFYKEQLDKNPNSNFLINTDPGKSLFVTQIYGTNKIVRQLNNLNFKLGQKVKLINKTPNGSVIVSFNNRLIGMGREIAQNIVVTLAN